MNKEYMYMLKAGDYYKFGITNNLEKRLSSLQNGNPLEIKLLNYVEYGDREHSKLAEKTLFSFLEMYRVKGEWFCLDNGEEPLDEVDLMLIFSILSWFPLITQFRLIKGFKNVSSYCIEKLKRSDLGFIRLQVHTCYYILKYYDQYVKGADLSEVYESCCLYLLGEDEIEDGE